MAHPVPSPVETLLGQRRTKVLCPCGLATVPYVSMEQVRLRQALTHLIPPLNSMRTNLGVEGL